MAENDWVMSPDPVHPNKENWRYIDNLPSGGRKAHPHVLGQMLQQVWEDQTDFNRLVKGFQNEVDDWVGTYLLGMIGSVKDVLQTIGWKKHERQPGPVNRDNLASDLADVTKYLLCAWQELGFTEREMLEALQSRGEVVRKQFARQIFKPEHKRVIVTDLDGTAADFRKEFARWAGLDNKVRSLAVDVDAGMPYDKYAAMKDEFERSGGYLACEIYPDWQQLIQAEQKAGTMIFVATARPTDRFKRVASDTQQWLEGRGIRADILLFGRDERIISLLELAGSNEVILLDDDPGLALRAANAGIPVLLREQPYNSNMPIHVLIEHWEKFPPRVDWDHHSYMKEKYAESKFKAA